MSLRPPWRRRRARRGWCAAGRRTSSTGPDCAAGPARRCGGWRVMLAGGLDPRRALAGVPGSAGTAALDGGRRGPGGIPREEFPGRNSPGGLGPARLWCSDSRAPVPQVPGRGWRGGGRWSCSPMWLISCSPRCQVTFSVIYRFLSFLPTSESCGASAAAAVLLLTT